MAIKKSAQFYKMYLNTSILSLVRQLQPTAQYMHQFREVRTPFPQSAQNLFLYKYTKISARSLNYPDIL